MGFRTVSTAEMSFKSADSESVTGIPGRALKTARVYSRFQCTCRIVVVDGRLDLDRIEVTQD